MKLSIVSPVYRASKILPLLVQRIENAVSPITTDYEIILVDDYSPDNSWNVIEQITADNTKVVGVKLSRNFGQHKAITAGLSCVSGDWVVVMDCDLQDQPEEIIKLFKKAQEGYDIVLASRHERKDSFFKKKFSALFYATLSYLTGTKQNTEIANFGIYNRKVIDVILDMKESIRYFPTMINWVGFRKIAINVEHATRSEGKSTYNIKGLFNLAIDIILAYSDKPIRLTVKFGVLVSLCSLLLALVLIIRWICGYITVMGYTSIILSIWFFSGIILSSLGVIGLYIGKTFEQVKNRPIFIIEKKTNT